MYRQRKDQQPGSSPEPLQPRPHPAQVSSDGARFVRAPGIQQMLDEVIPQVPVVVAQVPPGHPHRAQTIRIQWVRCGQVRRDGIQQRPVQAGQPLFPELGAQEVAEHGVQANAAGWKIIRGLVAAVSVAACVFLIAFLIAVLVGQGLVRVGL